jgi:arginine:pyruvate transaminase
MRPSAFTDRIATEGSRAWKTHSLAMVKRRAGQEVIVLSIGDPDFDTPQPVIEAAYTAMNDGYTHYADLVGTEELRTAIANYQGKLSGAIIDPANVVAVAGAQCGLFASALCTLDPGDEVITPSPTYITYEAVVGAPGATLVAVPTDPEKDFAIEPEAIRAAITPKTRAIMINSPNNPSGAMISRTALKEIGKMVFENDLWLICDQVYSGLVFEGENVCPLSLPGLAERTMIVNSLSKSHAMTGWRIGWIIIPEHMRMPFRNLMLCMLYGIPSFTQRAALTALDSDMAELKEMKATFAARRDTMAKGLKDAPTLICRTPPAGMFCMIDVRGTGLSSYDFAEGFLEAEGVSTLPGDAFGPSGAGHLRVSLMVPEETLRDACQRMIRYAGTLVS